MVLHDKSNGKTFPSTHASRTAVDDDNRSSTCRLDHNIKVLSEPTWGRDPHYAGRPYIEYVDVTPEIAQQILDRTNRLNRQLSPSTVEKYARLMVRGKWTFASDGISVNERGQLCNGQHRLTAVVQSGVTVPLELKWNVPSDVMGGYDIGLTRPAWVNAGLPAAARADGDMDISIVRKERARIQEVVTSIRLGFGTVGKLDADEYVALATKHEKALSWFLSVPSQARIIAPVAGAIVYAYPVQPRAVHRFAQSYIDGEGGVKGIPWFQLREQIPLKGKGRAKNMSQAEIFRRSCHALVKTIEEKKLFVLRDEEAHRVLERLREQMKAKK